MGLVQHLREIRRGGAHLLRSGGDRRDHFKLIGGGDEAPLLATGRIARSRNKGMQ
ncbi:MAG: hypothetical protein LH466_07125 [Sphingomonas bacterium]|nr:hypothetical protein [Sphingomonas bacterium]